ncbi:thioredoxin [Terrihabitans rhizophilus]|uniref:Thioredoxin n=1 Tax=Terrihabitans rhizophilus TaxID=3092662 RepID=A0ABU4RXB7_9HYPH|nr:thioredoxin [Terrihabitans sp. PJ23]MDX6807556.1 thioredoxin [Terrihabitans sp. PJ23]
MLLNEAPADAATGLVKDTTTANFMVDVVQESRTQPVLVDFWAPWCGPCKQLAPVLEKVVQQAGGKVKLVKMNTDEHPAVAGQLGIKSLPSVIAFVDGQPVDGFLGVQPEGQIRAFIERLTKPMDAADAAAMLEQAEALLAENDLAGAGEVYSALLAMNPEETRAMAGLVRVQIAAGDVEGATEFLDSLSPLLVNDPALAAVRAQIALAGNAPEAGEIAGLEAKLSADPDDHQSRSDLAVALAAAGRKEEAVDHLLAIVRKDRAWNEDGARKQLLQLFEAWGFADPVAVQGRRRLSSVLFS